MALRSSYSKPFNPDVHAHLVERGALYERHNLTDPNTGEIEEFDVYWFPGTDDDPQYFDCGGHFFA